MLSTSVQRLAASQLASACLVLHTTLCSPHTSHTHSHLVSLYHAGHILDGADAHQHTLSNAILLPTYVCLERINTYTLQLHIPEEFYCMRLSTVHAKT